MNESTARQRHLAEHGTEPEWARVGFKHEPQQVMGLLYTPASRDFSKLVRAVMRANRTNVNALMMLAASNPPIVSRRHRRANWRASRDTTHMPAIEGTGSHLERAQAHRANWPKVVEHGARYTEARYRAFLKVLRGDE